MLDSELTALWDKRRQKFWEQLNLAQNVRYKHGRMNSIRRRNATIGTWKNAECIIVFNKRQYKKDLSEFKNLVLMEEKRKNEIVKNIW